MRLPLATRVTCGWHTTLDVGLEGPSAPANDSVPYPFIVEPFRSQLLSSDLLASWCVPSSVEECYRSKGLTHLYESQVKCLQRLFPAPSDDILEDLTHNRLTPDVHGFLEQDRSLVVSAPTSGGKSLVAEVVALQAILFRAQNVLFTVPHIALVEEKVAHLRSVWTSAGIRVEALHSNSSHRMSWHPAIDCAVCTFEKANNILNK